MERQKDTGPKLIMLPDEKEGLHGLGRLIMLSINQNQLMVIVCEEGQFVQNKKEGFGRVTLLQSGNNALNVSIGFFRGNHLHGYAKTNSPAALNPQTGQPPPRQPSIQPVQPISTHSQKPRNTEVGTFPSTL